MGIISFHSLEDRLIKQRFKKLSGKANTRYVPKEFAILDNNPQKADAKIIKPFPINPSAEEVASNPRSRSAKLRVCEKKYKKIH